MGLEDSLNSLNSKMEELKKSKQDYFKEKLHYNFLLFSDALKRKDEKSFEHKKDMIEAIENSGIKQFNNVDDELEELFLNMEKEILGEIKTLEGESLEEIKAEFKIFWEKINKPLFNINNTPISLFKLILSLIILVIGFIVSKIYKHYIIKISTRSKTITESSKTLLLNLGHYFIFIITIFIVLNVLGIDLSSITLIAGALSVGIGFGLQNIISNFVSGIILMLERSIKIGDYIEIDDNTRGKVTDIKMRSITVNTNSNIDITIPNQSLVENQVTNWSMHDRIKRFEIPFGVAYGTSPQRVINLIVDAVNRSGFENIINTKERYTKVVMTEMADSSINFELFVWVAGRDIFKPKSVTSKFLILIYETLYENNIEIPFPQQDIHIRSLDDSIKEIIK